jgi:hypothetical protein
MNNFELQVQARKILDNIAFMPFEQCQPLTRGFESIPARPGIYAVRHRTGGLLYIGKTKSLRGCFSGGHKAFCGLGSIDIMTRMCELQYKSLHTGEIPRYY